jgi:hypothetical protein
MGNDYINVQKLEVSQSVRHKTRQREGICVCDWIMQSIIILCFVFLVSFCSVLLSFCFLYNTIYITGRKPKLVVIYTNIHTRARNKVYILFYLAQRGKLVRDIRELTYVYICMYVCCVLSKIK